MADKAGLAILFLCIFTKKNEVKLGIKEKKKCFSKSLYNQINYDYNRL